MQGDISKPFVFVFVNVVIGVQFLYPKKSISTESLHVAYVNLHPPHREAPTGMTASPTNNKLYESWPNFLRQSVQSVEHDA